MPDTAVIFLRLPKSNELTNIPKKANFFFDSETHFPSDHFKQASSQALTLKPNEKKAIDQDIMTRLLAFGERTFQGKSYINHLFYQRLNLFYYNKFRLYFALRDQTYLERKIQKVVVDYDSIIIYSPKQFPIFERQNKVSIHYQAPPKQPINYLSIQRYLRAVSIRFWKGFKYRKNALKSPYLIVNRPKDEHLLKRLSDLKEVKNNAYLGYVLEKYGQKAVILEELVLPKIKGTNPVNYMEHTQTRQAEERVIFGEYIMGKSVWRISVWRKAFQILNGFMITLMDLLEQEKDPFYQDIIRRLIHLKNTHLYFLIRYMAYERFFTKHPHFKSLTSIDENSSYIKSILDAAKTQDIKTIGIQHGSISTQSPNYMFSLADHIHHPMPDTTLVWGTAWQNLLLDQGHFPPTSVDVVGQIRADIIPRLKANKDSTNQSKFTIVFASQPIPNEALRQRALEDVLKAVKAHEDWHLIIKPHPRETDRNYFDNIAQNVDMDRYEWLYKVDLYDLLNRCDVLITCYSTVGGEAVYFQKPLIVLDHLKEDLVNYVKDEVAFQATNDQDLDFFLAQLASGDLNIDHVAYRNYIERYAYKVDGQVVDRVWECIKG